MNEWTPVGASTLLLVLRHSCWCFGTPVGATELLLRGRPRFDRCFGTPVAWAGTSCMVLRHLSTVSYLRVLIVLRPTHFL